MDRWSLGTGARPHAGGSTPIAARARTGGEDTVQKPLPGILRGV